MTTFKKKGQGGCPRPFTTNQSQIIMEKQWLRFGGFVYADQKTMASIKSGNVDALVGAILKGGIELNGESYIPDDETSFEINPLQLIVK